MHRSIGRASMDARFNKQLQSYVLETTIGVSFQPLQ